MIGKKINQLATELAPASTDLTIIGDPISGVSKKITIAQLGAIFSGAVSFYDNFAAFPATGDINVIYCAKDTKKLYLWSGSAYVEVFPSQALLDTYQLRSEKGNANGYASLDSGGKVPISQLPSSIMEYKGTWNAATNTPTLANGTGDTGDVYICNVAGTVNFGAGPLTFAVGDYVIYSGSIWQRSSGAVGTVTSVAASITGDAIGITGSPITTSGTLALAFAGNSTQYINGAGNLVTFPGIINEAQNLITEVYNKTGATLTKGTVVYINGGQGNLPSVTKALATGDSTSAQTYGIVRNDITNNNNGYVVVAGRISDLDTQAYTEGTQLYLSPTTAGTFTSTKPYAPQHLVYVGIVVRAHPTQGVVEVKIQNGYEMDELHNVAAQTPTNNDGLFWESATSLWKNKSIATILGYTPQAQLNGTGFVKASGTTITYDNNTYVTIDTFENITASKNFTVGLSLGSAGGTNQASVFANTNSIYSGSAGTNIFGFNTSNNIYFGKGLSNGGVIAWNNSTSRTYNLPDADGTIALVGGSGVGTVTSVSALTIGTTGTDITSTVANSTTTPVITLNVPTASATNRGALSSADWTTFNNKQNTLTNPVTGTGTTNYIAKFTGTSTIGNSLVFDNGTNVGIGTITPGEKLVVSDGTVNWYVNPNAANSSAFIGTSTNHALSFVTNGNERVRITNAGQVGIGTTNPSDKLTVTDTFFTFNIGAAPAGAGTLLYSLGSGGITFSTNTKASERMTITNGGNVGIGTNNPTFLLDVSGTLRATGAATFSSSVTSNSNTNGQIAISPSTNTNAAAFVASNAGGGCYFGKNNSTGGAFTGTAYATVVYSGGDVPMSFYTNDAERLRITSGGNLLLATSSDNSNGYLQIGGSSSNKISLTGGSTQNGMRWEAVGGANTFYLFNGTFGTAGWGLYNVTTAAAPLWVTNGGNVGIGTTSPGNFSGVGFAAPIFDVAGIIQIKGTATNTIAALQFGGDTFRKALIYSSVGTDTPYMAFGVATSGSSSSANEAMRITSGGNVRIVGGGDLEIYPASGSSYTAMYNDNDNFSIWNNGSERIRITSGGQLYLGNTTAVYSTNAKFEMLYSGAAVYGINMKTTSADAIHLNFVNSSGTQVGYIYSNGSSTSYVTSSDYRLKQDLKQYNGLDLISAIKTYDYEWKLDKTRAYGVLAHELQEIIPQAVIGEKDGIRMQGVDYSKIVPILVKAIQELKSELDTLKNK
jgi:hypothetical protein